MRHTAFIGHEADSRICGEYFQTAGTLNLQNPYTFGPLIYS